MIDNRNGYYTVAEVAAHYRVSRDTILRWIKSKRIAALNISTGRRATYRIPVGAVLTKRTAKPAKEIIP